MESTEDCYRALLDLKKENKKLRADIKLLAEALIKYSECVKNPNANKFNSVCESNDMKELANKHKR